MLALVGTEGASGKSRLLLDRRRGRVPRRAVAWAPYFEDDGRLDPLRCFSEKVGAKRSQPSACLELKADVAEDEHELSKGSIETGRLTSRSRAVKFALEGRRRREARRASARPAELGKQRTE